MAIDAHANLAREEFFDGKRAGEITQREIVVQLDHELRVGLRKKILSGNLASINGAEGNSCLVTRGLQGFRGAADVSLADKEVEIAVVAHGGITVKPAWQVRDL